MMMNWSSEMKEKNCQVVPGLTLWIMFGDQQEESNRQATVTNKVNGIENDGQFFFVCCETCETNLCKCTSKIDLLPICP